MKKFYKLVSVHKAPTGYEVHLDGRAVKVPSGKTLCAPVRGLAEALVQEWAAQEDTIKPDTMPLTQILTTRIDRVSAARADMTALLMKYLNTDLVCYHADKPEALAEEQGRIWGGVLDNFENTFGHRLEMTSGLKALEHSADAQNAVREYIETLDDDRFTVLQLVTSVGGSLILALGFLKGDHTADEVYQAAHIEEHFKGRIYNEDTHGAAPHEERKRANIRRDLEACERYLGLLA